MHKIEIAQQAIDISMRRRGRVQPFVAIEPRKTALLVVDMQTGFLEPGAVAEIAGGARDRSQHQPPGGHAAPRRGNGSLDRLDLWPGRRTRLDDVF